MCPWMSIGHGVIWISETKGVESTSMVVLFTQGNFLIPNIHPHPAVCLPTTHGTSESMKPIKYNSSLQS